MKHDEFTTRTELKSLTRSIKYVETEYGRLRMLKVCLGLLLHAPRGPFYSPKAARSRWRHSWKANLAFCRGGPPGPPGPPPDSPCSCPVRDLLPFLAHPTVADSWQLAYRTLSGAHRTVRCPLPTVGAPTRRAWIALSTVGAVDRWITGQSGAPPDSPVNFSRTPLNFSRERRLRRGRLTGQSGDL
jgi:hypothetical protein